MVEKNFFDDNEDSGNNVGSDIEVQEDYDHELNDNAVFDLVQYTRANTIKNEEQFVLVFLSYTTGFMESPDNYVSGVVIGTTSSGKTHLQRQVERLFPDKFMYEATTGSDTSIIYDDSWEDAMIASLDELQKPSEKIIEILKSLHGDDEEFKYKVTADGDGADRDVDEIVRTAIPYWFLYAQHDPDLEMWSRLLKVPVHESASKNRGVIRSNWGHEGIEFDGDTDVEYMGESHDVECAIQDRVLDMPKSGRVKIPAGEEEFGWDAIEHVEEMFDASRSETNRASAMVANLVRASALYNFKNRDTTEIYVDDNDEYVKHYVAEPQDVANIISCRRVLLATTHEIDRKKIAVCTAIEEKSDTSNRATINDIKDYLDEKDTPRIKRHQIENILTELRENYAIDRHEGAGPNGRNMYEFNGWENFVGTITVDEKFRDVFGDCVNPVTGENFVEFVEDMNEELLPTADDFEKFEDVDSGSAQSRINEENKLYMMRPHVYEALEHLYDTIGDSETYENPDEVRIQDMLGIGREHEGSILDSEHEVWDQKGKPEEWVNNNNQAISKIDDAVGKLFNRGLFRTENLDDGSKRIEVTDPEDVDIEITEVMNDDIEATRK